jgi:enoyl-CoA hydratase/carnithine racemase
MSHESPVLFSTLPAANNKRIGIATLNRPKALNALTLEMCDAMLTQFRVWQADDTIVAVVLNAEGEKAFCAGGDVAEVVRQVNAGGADRFAYGDAFFTVEYALDLLIHQFEKPFIALAHGITMGGGLGLVAGASHRVVSTHARLAMPEIHIGLFPDVGGGFFLNRLPCRAGWFMALTGHIINEHDAVLVGMADAILPAAQFSTFLSALQTAPWTNDARENLRITTASLNACPEKTAPQVLEAALWQRLPHVHAIMQQPTVTHVRDALTAASQVDPWFAGAAKNLANGSPTTAHVAFEYLRRSLKLSIAEVLEMDLRLAKQFPRHADFREGVRAVLIDKDKSPRWSPADFNAVNEALVDAYFLPLER